MATIVGTTIDDTLVGTPQRDVILGVEGNDRLYGDDGNDTLRGGPGDDTLDGGDGSDQLYGGDGDDWLYGAAPRLPDGVGDIFWGGNGSDTLVGDNGNDELHGDAGDDWLYGGAGDDILDGGDTPDPYWPSWWTDWDRADYYVYTSDTSDGPGVQVSLATGVAHDFDGGTDTLIDIEEVWASPYDDTLIGGNALNDDYEAFVGFRGNDYIDGGTGRDVIRYYVEYVRQQTSYPYNTTPLRILVDLELGMVWDTYGDLDTVTNVEVIVATPTDDTLLGSSGDDEFQPLSGNDFIDGRLGSDTVSYEWNWREIGAYYGVDADLVRGSVLDPQRGFDRVISVENVTGSYLDDTLRGNALENTLRGVDGNDLLKGAGGNDRLEGGHGTDHLDGGRHADILDGGQGNDTLRGGYSYDTFVFGLDCDEDTILDFRTGVDRIDVSAFGFADTADVMARFSVLSPDAAMLDLGGDNYVIFAYVDTSQTVLAAGDIIV